ncbi:hypothetical protein F4560_002341 [Saccharothrix ecbatanensis]|uniref:WD40 repeat protein n=1 Tax=Saccharothrix ecbatanensis TaxID=1105145 RepID=A0A7W9M0A5_9PSEU|nr:hypothetical protein [Saccharothrix ecbatanensis]MBB5802573.1 hypothetical protein [Saccharothrix ecbatanensis]
MRKLRRLVVALVAITAVVVPSAPAGAAAATPRLTRVDTDTAGQPDPKGGVVFTGLSGDGRHALLAAYSHSTLVPAPHRTPADQGVYLVRKDLQSGALVLVSVRENGSPLAVSWEAGMGHTGTTFAYAGRVNAGPMVLYYRDLTSGVRPIYTMSGDWSPNKITLSSDGRWLSWLARNNAAGGVIIRHDLHTGQTTRLLECADPLTGCYIYTGPLFSDDGTTIALQYRKTPADPIRLAVLDPGAVEPRILPEGVQGEGFVISGNGKWIFYGRGSGCPGCGGGRFELKRIATTPGASPQLLRAWEDGVTWGLYPTSSDRTGTLVGYFRQTGDSGKYYAAARGYLHDMLTGIETRLPEPRTELAYAAQPKISSNSRVAVFVESCLSATSCYPTGTYAVALTTLLPGRMWAFDQR